MGAHAFHPSTWEKVFEASLVHIVSSRPGLHSEALLQKQNNKTTTKETHKNNSKKKKNLKTVIAMCCPRSNLR